MKNYFNKALIYREWKNIKALAVLFSLEIICVMILPFIQEIRRAINQSSNIQMYGNRYFYDIKDYFFRNQITSMALIGGAILIGTIIIGGDLIGRKYDELNSLPFKREEIIVSKWVVGVLVIIIPLIIGTSLVHSIYNMNEDIIGCIVTNKMILTWSSINILVSVFVFTFIMLIQTLSGKPLVGGIVGGILLIFPIGFGGLLFSVMSIFRGNPNIANFIHNHFNGILDKLYIFARSITPAGYGFDLKLEKQQTQDFYYYDIFDQIFTPKLKVVFLILFIIAAFILMIYAFKKVPLERCGYIVIFKPLEIIFKIGVSVSFGLLGSVIVEPILDAHYDLWELERLNSPELIHVVNKACTLTVLIGLLCGCIVYVITNKIIEASKK